MGALRLESRILKQGTEKLPAISCKADSSPLWFIDASLCATITYSAATFCSNCL
jgi:hypothetical protein